MKLQGIQKLLRDFVGIIFPDLCIACYDNPPLKGELFCLSCERELIPTDFHERRDNEFEAHFVGRIDIVRGACLFIYRKGTSIQQILHHLKYKSKSEVGYQLGLRYGEKLNKSDFLHGIDAMIPVPLHWKKQKKRGYNRSEVFAKGISQITGIPVWNKILLKSSETESQTRMSRMERVENVMAGFEIKNKEQLEGKHILIIDDVLTTGATLEACAIQILPFSKQISMLTIAMGRI